MARILPGLLLVFGFFLLLSDPRSASAQKGGNNGTITKVDAKSGAITINMLVVAKKKKELMDKEYFLNDDAVVIIVEGGAKKTLTGKEALASGALKTGTAVTFSAINELNIKELTVGGGKK